MANRLSSIFDSGPRLFGRKFPATERPLRSELFNPEQMQNYGKILAETHTLSESHHRSNGLLRRLEENERVLDEVRNLLTEAVAENRRIVPAADWILDNYYLIDDNIRTSKRDLPKGYNKKLPRLKSSIPDGLPRVYDIVSERISHGDGLVDPETLPAFFASYQSVASLTLGELWAIPIMMRLALIENLRRVAVRISEDMRIQRKADYWADRLIARAQADPKNLILLIADIVRSDTPMGSPFVTELALRLQHKGPALALTLTWIEQQLAETNVTIDSLVQSGMQQQAADQVSVSNTIRSLRFLNMKDWKEFVESTSAVEKKLREDPSGHYAKMDFRTRDKYRHVVEALAEKKHVSEEIVAGFAIDLAHERCISSGSEDRASHVGFYLVDKGFSLLRNKISAKQTFTERVSRFAEDRPLLFYAGGIVSLSAALSFFLVAVLYRTSLSEWALALLGLLAFICAIGLSVNIVNWLVMFIFNPHQLPRMDYAYGIPLESKTLVVVPSMLSSIVHIDNLIEALEVRLLANRDENLYFGLLTDYPDADAECLPSDEELLAYAQNKIMELNVLYKTRLTEPLFLFHRPRLWNASERAWIGYERKRGKLSALNNLILHGVDSPFEAIVGKRDQLAGVKYIITLDTDTQLPRDSARLLVAAMSHPLNRARYDSVKSRVTDGYGILQPRIAPSLSGADRSVYARLAANDPGIDPYTRVVSDVYQDVFSEGSFVGKGIYDIEAFELTLKDSFPENQILSHDLLEGCYVRSGFISDIQLIEASPYSYSSDVERRSRWMRGDWQITQWLLTRVPGLGGERRINPISSLSKWKIADNLRRSITSISLILLLLLGWTVLNDPVLWSLSVAAVIFIPSCISVLCAIVRKPKDTALISHLSTSLRTAALHFVPALFTLAVLPYDAFFSLKTILKVNWRLLVSRAHLLEWKASEEKNHKDTSSIGASVSMMWISPFLALVLAIVFLITDPITFFVASPFLLLWLLSPVAAWWISKPITKKKMYLSGEQEAFLHRLARKTWVYFETFVTPEENWLPPDNFQEIPSGKIAHRTSPTNMGLALLANLTARDLGYIPVGVLLERTLVTLQSMSTLERYRNHFFNWYDTITKKPLPPRYISTVDSGNLSAHLLTLRAGILALADENPLDSGIWTGLLDTRNILESLFENKIPASLTRFNQEFDKIRDSIPLTISETWDSLSTLTLLAENMYAELKNAPFSWWVNALKRQCQEALEELVYLFPWIIAHSRCANEISLMEAGSSGSLRDLSISEVTLAENMRIRLGENCSATEKAFLAEMILLIDEGRAHAEKRLSAIDELSLMLEEMALMDFKMLYDKRQHLFMIGYNIDSRRRDSGFYDLLASEARLVSFLAIAQGQIPQENWFTLGRALNDSSGEPVLLSWSGSMFEYLMPLLVMPLYDKTLLSQTYLSAIERQIEYGKLRGVPWGISESGFNSLDSALNYQYHAFGVPGLGLKRGLVDDLVIAPYATALALLVEPAKACENLQRLSAEGFEGDYGLYEAIDFTKSRIPHGHSRAIVRSFMAHHQGMSLLSFASQLLSSPMQKRFESIPAIRATVLLLEEKIPKKSNIPLRLMAIPELPVAEKTAETAVRIFKKHDTPEIELQLLSNGAYHVMVTNSGGGYSCWKDLAVTRWAEDGTCDDKGTFVYLRDASTNTVWSNTFQPTLKIPESYEVIFSENRAEYRRKDEDIETYTEIIVSPEDDIELRRIRITNRSRGRKNIEVTSYAEIVLASGASDAAHPAFSNLFVQTEILEDKQAILCNRRSRSPEESFPWVFHLLNVRDGKKTETSFETDRSKFLGRGNSAANPAALKGRTVLSGSQGSVLDPVCAIRQAISITPDATVVIDLVTGISKTREEALLLVEKYQGKRFANRAFELSQTHSQIVLRQIAGTEAEANLYNHLAGSILYANANLRTERGNIETNRRGQSGLWGYSISGDLPIVLVLIRDPANIALVGQLVKAHIYWHRKGLKVDLIIWNEEYGSYRQILHEEILTAIAANGDVANINKSGGIFVRSSDQISAEDRTLIQAVARVVLSDVRGTLEEQVFSQNEPVKKMPLMLTRKIVPFRGEAQEKKNKELLFFNGFGGFTPDGKEYIIAVSGTERTPAPWTNVIANPLFGTVVSDSGSAYTWSENAHEFRLTPWTNDAVSDSSGEAMYIRDEDSGQFWSPSSLPKRGEGEYVTRHGFGYSAFEHDESGISSELLVCVAKTDPVKFMTLKIKNESKRPRTLTVTFYAELVLGERRSKSAMHIITEIDSGTGAIFAKNWFNTDFSGRTIFLDSDGDGKTLTCDRTEFIGKYGNLGNPDAMSRTRLSGKTGTALDPCAALRVTLTLSAGQEKETVFILGAARDSAEASELVARYRITGSAAEALNEVHEYWNETLSALQVETPDASLNILANGWLMYQTLSSRLWGRSGFYQSGGAFGFRDQLQDSMALVHTEPDLVRAHLLLCASHQFVEGDVQHWWHPPTNKGSRSFCSDDSLWLPLSVCRYVSVTNDMSVLDETVPFLEGRPVNDDEESYYDLSSQSGESSTLYEHCARAIVRSGKRGTHGLPLIGSGDWNDGMNRVGIQGKGESVWLAFFLHSVLMEFSKLALIRGDKTFSELCIHDAETLKAEIEKHGWDGSWYRRAYFDDGTPLGSKSNSECRIDSIAQSWSVLSGSGNKEHSKKAMQSLELFLVPEDRNFARLLDPPFDVALPNPGYIRGYVPGVRENGGQYTHAAIWAAMAFASLGDTHKAWDFFNMCNPIYHSDTHEKIAVYKVDPYVMSADIYTVAPHIGRGGWTWYTGSAGWMYRLITESILGLHIEGDRMSFTPCIPKEWENFVLHYRYKNTLYHIAISQAREEKKSKKITLDAIPQSSDVVHLIDDGMNHQVEVHI